MTHEQQKRLFGQEGADIVTNTSAATPTQCRWYAITVLEDAVINTCIVDNVSLNGTASETALASVSLKAGTTLFLNIKSITLTSGKVMLYRTTAEA